MNKSKRTVFSLGVLGLLALGLRAQDETKSFTESYNVSKDAVLNLDTSNADIEFETWNKDQIEVVATISLEGASKEEAEAYFKKNPVKIMGNSTEVTVSTGPENVWYFVNGDHMKGNYRVDIPNMNMFLMDIPAVPPMPDVPAVPSIPEMYGLDMIPPMPPMPAMNMKEFDYDAYKKDGKTYLEKWSKDFDKNFSEGYQKELEKWKEEVVKNREEFAKHREEARKAQVEALKESRKSMNEAREAQREALQQQRAEMDKARTEQRKMLVELQKAREEEGAQSSKYTFLSPNNNTDADTNIFYISRDGKTKDYKIKKTIKIKMPKNTKLKMNVRHGEVKLAENTINIDATLSYATLLGTTVGGNGTSIQASYSPVSVQKWNYGKLRTEYSDKVYLKDVDNIALDGLSSNVAIGHIGKKAVINTDLGTLDIQGVSNDFTELNVSVKRGDLQCALPSGSYTFRGKGSYSKFQYPTTINMVQTGSTASLGLQGHKGTKGSAKIIVVDAKYGNVVLE